MIRPSTTSMAKVQPAAALMRSPHVLRGAGCSVSTAGVVGGGGAQGEGKGECGVLARAARHSQVAVRLPEEHHKRNDQELQHQRGDEHRIPELLHRECERASALHDVEVTRRSIRYV